MRESIYNLSDLRREDGRKLFYVLRFEERTEIREVERKSLYKRRKRTEEEKFTWGSEPEETKWGAVQGQD